ncbi:MAG TPA: sugar ABC transporter substrate-binding protein [Epulopiscium sp.]|nr:sugar ABC transporter substrate-binding protein [Candidatus Epulonipiscium sp.]
MKNIVRTFIMTGIGVVLLVGCSRGGAKNPTVNQVENDRIQIGLSFDSFVIERWQRDRDIFVSTAKELGADVNVQIASGDVNKQISQIEYFIDKNMDVIVIIPTDANLLKESVLKAKQKGIKVIAYDRLIQNSDVDLYISFDNEKVGTLMAQAIVENIPRQGEIAFILGSEVDHNVMQVKKGLEDVINNTDIKVVSIDYAQGWIAEEAFSAVNQVLKTKPYINGLVCGNDDLASQAIKALSEHRLAGSVYVVGQDADLNACQRIVEGTQTMTVYKSIEQLAKKAAEYAVTLGKNEEILGRNKIFDGSYYVPYEKLEPVAVTKENMDEIIIDGGFHLREEVYLNVLDPVEE